MTGLIFLIVGIVLAAFLTQVISSTGESTLDKWDNVWPSTILYPQSQGPSWTLEMPDGSFFELNVSASGTVRLRIGLSIYNNDTGEEILTSIIFNQVGTLFTQKVAVGATDTYQVEIKNEGTTPVIIWGNVSAKKIATTYQSLPLFLVRDFSDAGRVDFAGLRSLD